MAHAGIDAHHSTYDKVLRPLSSESDSTSVSTISATCSGETSYGDKLPIATVHVTTTQSYTYSALDSSTPAPELYTPLPPCYRFTFPTCLATRCPFGLAATTITISVTKKTAVSGPPDTTDAPSFPGGPKGDTQPQGNGNWGGSSPESNGGGVDNGPGTGNGNGDGNGHGNGSGHGNGNGDGSGNGNGNGNGSGDGNGNDNNPHHASQPAADPRLARPTSPDTSANANGGQSVSDTQPPPPPPDPITITTNGQTFIVSTDTLGVIIITTTAGTTPQPTHTLTDSSHGNSGWSIFTISGGITVSADATRAEIQGATYTIGSGAPITTTVLQGETISSGPDGVGVAPTHVDGAAHKGGADRAVFGTAVVGLGMVFALSLCVVGML